MVLIIIKVELHFIPISKSQKCKILRGLPAKGSQGVDDGVSHWSAWLVRVVWLVRLGNSNSGTFWSRYANAAIKVFKDNTLSCIWIRMLITISDGWGALYPQNSKPTFGLSLISEDFLSASGK